MALYDYDALGRRIREKKDFVDSVPSVVTLFYYNPDWQVLAEYDGANGLQRYFVYGNYIDEPLVMHRQSDGEDYYYGQDHLYSTVVLLDDGGNVVERYEYDAYGTARIMDASYNSCSVSSCGNAYTFTGRRLDVLDDGNLLRMHYRHRDYDFYIAIFLQEDPRGISPLDAESNPFEPRRQYFDSINNRMYLRANPVYDCDPLGLYDPSRTWLHYFLNYFRRPENRDVTVNDPSAQIIRELQELSIVQEVRELEKHNAEQALRRRSKAMACPVSLSFRESHSRDLLCVPLLENPGLRVTLQRFTLFTGTYCVFGKFCFPSSRCACGTVLGLCLSEFHAHDVYDFEPWNPWRVTGRPYQLDIYWYEYFVVGPFCASKDLDGTNNDFP